MKEVNPMETHPTDSQQPSLSLWLSQSRMPTDEKIFINRQDLSQAIINGKKLLEAGENVSISPHRLALDPIH